MKVGIMKPALIRDVKPAIHDPDAKPAGFGARSVGVGGRHLDRFADEGLKLVQAGMVSGKQVEVAFE